jgi:NADPH-dependent 2,4-dienoyl-CoA reductase/sulfur reductase-like enzyme
VVEAARQFLADPDFPNKVRSGREKTAKKCMRCLSCFSSELTNGEPYCAINPETGRELEMKYAIPDATKKKVLVVGGGVGGMQAALTSWERGHEVILCEKSDQLGGVLRCEDAVSFKQPLGFYLNQQAQAILDAGIEVRLNTTVTPDYAIAQEADVIFAALGAQPVKPGIPGIDGPTVWSAQDAYLSVDQLGDTVIILGAGLVGIELGLHLISQGKNVTILEMQDRFNDGGNFLHGLGLNVEINKKGLAIIYHAKAAQITETQVHYETPDGEATLSGDAVIYAVGQKPLQAEAIALNFCAPEFHFIGDCVAPRNITSATSEAFIMAREIGRS